MCFPAEDDVMIFNSRLKSHLSHQSLHQIFPELVVPAPSFSAVVMGRNVVVVEKKLCWSDALFYCRDLHWDLLSVRSEEEQREVEEALKNVPFPLTQYVWFGRRR